MKYMVLVFCLIFLSCKKDNSCEVCGRPNQMLEGVVIDAGLVGADGCGWLLRVGTSDLHPVNLPDSLKVTQTPVIVSFNVKNDKFFCGLAPGAGIQVVEILTIKRK